MVAASREGKVVGIHQWQSLCTRCMWYGLLTFWWYEGSNL